jgi:hypothetical protein
MDAPSCQEFLFGSGLRGLQLYIRISVENRVKRKPARTCNREARLGSDGYERHMILGPYGGEGQKTAIRVFSTAMKRFWGLQKCCSGFASVSRRSGSLRQIVSLAALDQTGKEY